jgi:shikimate dehydrogenase
LNREAQKGLYGLIGYPVSHSLSPAIFTAAFDAAGINATYELYPIAPDRLEEGVNEILGRGVRGLNVTVPHKAGVIPLMTQLDESARLAGAVNTIEVRSEGMVGHNTDMRGFEDSFVPLGVPDIQGCRVLVLGAGGAARAVLVSLARHGASEILVANRYVDEAVDLVSFVTRQYTDVRFRVLPLEEREIGQAVPETVLCVQATSLGLKETDPLPMDPSLLPGDCFIYDLVYGPAETAFVRTARSRGYQAADGKEMLLRQAAVSFLIWFRKNPPIDAMKAGIDGAIRGAAAGGRKPETVGGKPPDDTF